MRSTVDCRLLSLLPVPENALCLMVLVLSVVATSVFGQEKVTTLAMVRYDQSPATTPSSARVDTTLIPFRNVSAPRLQYRVAALKPDNQSDTGFSADARLEKMGGPSQHDLLQLVHKKFGPAGRTGNWMDVDAGYGQISHNESGLSRNTVELQRPGFAYLKASFSF